MAHQLEKSDHMAYAMEAPWHKLGVQLPGLATSGEMLAAVADMDEQVLKVPQYNTHRYLETGQLEEVPGLYQTVAANRHVVYGSVGANYTVFQNRDAFAAVDALTKDPNGPKYETAGLLYGGRVCWALAVMPDHCSLKVGGNDTVKPYILISNSHDGSSAIQLALTYVRVVCANTHRLALSGKQQNRIKVRHTSGAGARLKNAADAIGLIVEESVKLQDVYNAFRDTSVTVEQATEVCQRLIGETKTKRADNIIDNMIGKFNGNMIGYDLAGERNAWTLFNAITEFENHDRIANYNPDKAFQTVLRAGGAQRIQSAYTMIKELVGVN